MKRKIIITGGEGMVGEVADFGIKLSHKQLDILNKTSIEKAIKKYKPEVILHLAAMVNMLECENFPEKAYKINVVGTENLLRACKKHNIKFVYFSSGAVFDGKKSAPYLEEDKAHPLNVYGQTKLLGEAMTKKFLPDSLVVRTGWLFGEVSNEKFLNSTFKKLKDGQEVKAVKDRTGSPTYIPDLLEKVKTIIDENKKGIYHVVNSGGASYFDIAKEIKKIAKFKTSVVGIKASDIKGDKIKRGKSEVLKSSKIKLRPWKVALKEYILKLNK